MKKILFGMMALAVAATASAKTADELRIYINPGHGSWTANDRPATLVGHGEYSRTNTDTTGFFESNTNLQKGFGVLEKLRTYGLKYDPTLNQTGEPHMIGAARDMSNNIVMSHVKCGPYHDDNGTEGQLGDAAPADLDYYNRSLSEISAEVDANHFDMFISIHSNAATEGGSTNYPLYLYRGYDTPTEDTGLTLEHQTTSRAMADACWGESFANPHMGWTNYSATNKNLRGDCNFYSNPQVSELGYKGYLGVLKHGVPGFLVEGYFHTYQPARHRAMNWDVDHMEGAAYAHGIADYFGLTKETTGDIYGIVRDRYTTFKDDSYKPNGATEDKYLPINGVKVVLSQGDTKVAEYTTDNYYNGAFVFKDVEPGEYTLTVESDNYLPLEEPVKVTVTAAQISYPSIRVVDVNYVPPTKVYVDYPDVNNNKGINAANEYNLNAAVVDKEIAELAGMTVRRVVAQGNYLYVLALDEQKKPTVLMLNADLEVVRTLGVTATDVNATALDLADIQITPDGYLIGCSETLTQFDDGSVDEGCVRGYVKFYKWDNNANGLPEGEASVWFESEKTGNALRAISGHTFIFRGTMNDGLIFYPSAHATNDNGNFFYNHYTISEGEPVAYKFNNNKDALGELGSVFLKEDYTFTLAPFDIDQYVVNSPEGPAKAYELDPVEDVFAAISELSTDILPAASAGNAYFKHAGHSYMVAPSLDENNASTGIKLIDVTDGLSTASVVKLTGADVPAAEGLALSAGLPVVTYADDEETKVIALDFNLYLVRGNKFSMFTTAGVQQPTSRREYAYDLVSEEGDDAYTVTFKVTGDVADAAIVITPEEGEAITKPLGALAAGEHTFTVAKSELDMAVNYNWAVSVTSGTISQPDLFSSDPSELTVRGSVVPITDPEQASYGYVTVGHGNNMGIDIYNPSGEKVATRIFKSHAMFGGEGGDNGLTNQSNPIRGDELNGNAVLATWGGAAAGMVAINPLDANQEPYTLFAGENDGTGNFVYNGTNLGGGTPGISFITSGNDTYVITFSEDHEGLNGSGSTENTLCRQHLGTDWTITEAPVSLGFGGLLANTNVDIVTYGTGVFVSQVRGSGNNQSSTPCFAYISEVLTDDYATVMTSADEGIAEYIDGNNSSIAITTDGKTFAAGLTGKIVIFDVEWDGNTPKFTYSYEFPTETNSWATMRFDAAGNLHAYLREGGYRVYTLPGVDPVATTPAASKYFFGTQEGIETITTTDAADAADAVYYNLQGVRVAADCLTPGVYVRVNGTKAVKVLVK